MKNGRQTVHLHELSVARILSVLGVGTGIRGNVWPAAHFRLFSPLRFVKLRRLVDAREVLL